MKIPNQTKPKIQKKKFNFKEFLVKHYKALLFIALFLLGTIFPGIVFFQYSATVVLFINVACIIGRIVSAFDRYLTNRFLKPLSFEELCKRSGLDINDPDVEASINMIKEAAVNLPSDEEYFKNKESN